MNSNTDTENKIFNAAIKIFINKGKEGARMQDIANEANVNKALLHYYFRSKEKIFNKICEDIIEKLKVSLFSIKEGSTDFESFLKMFIEKHFGFFNEHQDLLAFAFWEMRKENDTIKKIFKEKFDDKGTPVHFLINQLKAAEKKGEVRKGIDPFSLYLNILSLNSFIFLAKPMALFLLDLSEDDFNKMQSNRCKITFELIWNSIKPD